MKLTCTSCGRGKVLYGEHCAYCGTRNHDNTESLNQFWGKGKPERARPKKSGSSFFSPAWAIPFKLIGLIGRGVWRLVKVPF